MRSAGSASASSQLLLSVTIAVVALVMLGCGGHEPACKSYRFDAERWVDPHGDHPSARRQEGLALARCHRLIGLTDVEVMEMLGSAPIRLGSNHWRYEIGPATELSDAGALEVHLRRGRVVSAEAY
jgi:hypothetical protein